MPVNFAPSIVVVPEKFSVRSLPPPVTVPPNVGVVPVGPVTVATAAFDVVAVKEPLYPASVAVIVCAASLSPALAQRRQGHGRDRRNRGGGSVQPRR